MVKAERERPTRCPIATDFGFMKIELQMKPKIDYCRIVLQLLLYYIDCEIEDNDKIFKGHGTCGSGKWICDF